MKHNNLRIAIIEEGKFYNNLIENIILSKCKECCPKLNWVIKSFGDIESFNKSNTVLHMIVFNNYIKKSNKNIAYDVRDVIEKVKRKNKNCLFVTISGYLEMHILAEFYKDDELQFYFSKHSNINSLSAEEHCPVSAFNTILDKLLSDFAQNESSGSAQVQNTGGLRISA